MTALSLGVDRPSVFVVDGDQPSRTTVLHILASHDLPVEAFDTGEAVLPLLASRQPACVVAEVRLAGMSGLDLQTAAVDAAPHVTFVFLTGHDHVPDVVRAMKNGAIDYLPVPADDMTLVAAVRRGLRASAEAFARRAAETDAASRLARLSRREHEVCRFVVRGLLNKQIAAELGTSEKTVKTQRGRALRKLGVSSTAALVDLLRTAGE